MRASRSRPSPLSADEIATLEAQLLEQRRALEVRLRQSLSTVRGDGAPRRATEHADGADAPDTDPQEDLAFALMQSHAEMMARIDQALHRLAAGRYGQCGECGRAIGAARLLALPFAARCLPCEREREDAHVAVASRRSPATDGGAFDRLW